MGLPFDLILSRGKADCLKSVVPCRELVLALAIWNDSRTGVDVSDYHAHVFGSGPRDEVFLLLDVELDVVKNVKLSQVVRVGVAEYPVLLDEIVLVGENKAIAVKRRVFVSVYSYLRLYVVAELSGVPHVNLCKRLV